MSRAEKREIERLQEEVRRSLDSVGGWQTACLNLEQEAKALREANKEKIKAYREANKEKLAIYNREYRKRKALEGQI